MPTATIQEAFEVALQHHQAGRLSAAEALYRQILAVEPHHAEALHLLGVIAHQAGKNDVAMDLIRQALALNPAFPAAYNNLGTVLREAGQLQDAIIAHRRAIALTPDFPDAHYNLGIALYDQGQLHDAIAAYRETLLLKPAFPKAHYNLGNALRQQGHPEEAIASYRQAIALEANYPEALTNLGTLLYEKGELDEAVAAYRQALALKPDFPNGYTNLGNALKKRGQLDEAIASYRQALALQPDYPDALSNLGTVLYDKGRIDEAITAYRKAIAIRPNSPEVCNNLGNALKEKGQFDEAIASYRRAVSIKADYPECHSNLGNALKDTGQLDEAIAEHRLAVALEPDFPETHSNLLVALNYHPAIDAQAIAEEHRRWNHRHAEPLLKFIQPHRNDPDPDRRLRIGYVSPDFREHPVGRFLLPLLARHDHSRFEVACYAHVTTPDTVTAQLRAHADHWHSLIGLSDVQAAKLIRDQRIDILVDLSGHTAHDRLLVFARKPAPVQVSYLGYPNTTGLTTIGYRLTDAHADPPGLADLDYSERLIRLPSCAWCFQPTPCPDVTARRDRPITFGSFNNFAKVTEPMLALWARILNAVPASRLLLKALSLGSDGTRQRVHRSLEKEGIAAERVELRGFEAVSETHLALYDRIDVGLDTYPYHGTTTTCEALWMGVPVVTLAGKTHASRVGVSLLTSVGLTDLIARDEDEYVRIAATLAADGPRLSALRAALRGKMNASALMDAPRFARDVEAAYSGIWREWCTKQSARDVR